MSERGAGTPGARPPGYRPEHAVLARDAGSWDPAAAMMTVRTEATVAGGRTLAWGETTQSIDRDTRVFRSFFPGPDGGEHEMMTVTYRRRRPGGDQEAQP